MKERILEKIEIDELTNKPVETVEASFNYNRISYLIKSLGKTLYKDIKQAIIREIVSNAWDANIENNSEKPVIITIDNDSNLIISDNGKGMSDDFINNKYMKWMYTTKNKANLTIGMHGIGSKSPLGYVDDFEIETSWLDEKTKTIITNNYILFNTEHLPKIKLINSRKSVKNSTGTKIKIKIKNQYDVASFVKIILNDCLYFENVLLNIEYPNSYNFLSKNVENFNNRVINKGKYFTSVTKNESIVRQNCKLLHGNVLYDIELDKFDDKTATIIKYYVHHTPIQLPIGTLDITLSRDTIEYTEYSKNNIIKYLNYYIDELHERTKKENHYKNIFEYYKKNNITIYNHLYHYYNEYYGKLKSDIALHKINGFNDEYFLKKITKNINEINSLINVYNNLNFKKYYIYENELDNLCNNLNIKKSNFLKTEYSNELIILKSPCYKTYKDIKYIFELNNIFYAIEIYKSIINGIKNDYTKLTSKSSIIKNYIKYINELKIEKEKEKEKINLKRKESLKKRKELLKNDLEKFKLKVNITDLSEEYTNGQLYLYLKSYKYIYYNYKLNFVKKSFDFKINNELVVININESHLKIFKKYLNLNNFKLNLQPLNNIKKNKYVINNVKKYILFSKYKIKSLSKYNSYILSKIEIINPKLYKLTKTLDELYHNLFNYNYMLVRAYFKIIKINSCNITIKEYNNVSINTHDPIIKINKKDKIDFEKYKKLYDEYINEYFNVINIINSTTYYRTYIDLMYYIFVLFKIKGTISLNKFKKKLNDKLSKNNYNLLNKKF